MVIGETADLQAGRHGSAGLSKGLADEGQGFLVGQGFGYEMGCRQFFPGKEEGGSLV